MKTVHPSDPAFAHGHSGGYFAEPTYFRASESVQRESATRTLGDQPPCVVPITMQGHVQFVAAAWSAIGLVVLDREPREGGS